MSSQVTIIFLNKHFFFYSQLTLTLTYIFKAILPGLSASNLKFAVSKPSLRRRFPLQTSSTFWYNLRAYFVISFFHSYLLLHANEVSTEKTLVPNAFFRSINFIVIITMRDVTTHRVDKHRKGRFVALEKSTLENLIYLLFVQAISRSYGEGFRS